MSTSICPVTKESATQPVFEQFATACTSKAGRGKKDWLAMFEKLVMARDKGHAKRRETLTQRQDFFHFLPPPPPPSLSVGVCICARARVCVCVCVCVYVRACVPACVHECELMLPMFVSCKVLKMPFVFLTWCWETA